MTFTFKDIFYIFIIIVLFFLFIGKRKDFSKLKKQSEEYKNAWEGLKYNYEDSIRNLNKLILHSKETEDSLLLAIQSIDEKIKLIKIPHEQTRVYIDTASINEVIRYWTRELRSDSL